MRQAEFTALMSKLRACYQNAVKDPDQWLASISQYWTVVRSYNDEAIRRAFNNAWRQHPDWMPSLGQLVELIENAGGSAKHRAAQAWPEVMRLASQSSGDHSDPVAAEAIRLMGGGKRLGQMPTDDLEVWGRKRFDELYEEIASAPPERPQLTDGGTDAAKLIGELAESKAIGDGRP